MNIFHFRKRFFILFLAFLFLTGGLQLLSKITDKEPLFLFSEIQTASVNFKEGLGLLIEKYLFLLELRDQNRDLKKKNQELKVQVQLSEELKKENERLKKLMDFSLHQRFQLLPAQVLGTGFLSKNELLTINKGSRQGLKKFMGVLHKEGVVGYIFRVSPNSSQVISLLNPLSSLPARNQNSRILGLISPGGKNRLLFHHLNQDLSEKQIEMDMKKGDPIVSTSSDSFPAGLIVGSVLSPKKTSPYSPPEIYVQPAVPFHSLEEVLVILNPKKTNNEEKEKNP